MNRSPLTQISAPSVQASPELRAQVERERQSQAFNNCVRLHKADPSKVGVIGSPSFNQCLQAGAAVAHRTGGATPEETLEAQIQALGAPKWPWVVAAVGVVGVGVLLYMARSKT